MKFLSLDLIKQQSRLDCTCEAELLKLYGESAEQTLFQYLDRTYEEIIAAYGAVPAPLIQAALMLVDVSYTHRSPVSSQAMSVVPYTFDILVKPYIKL